MLGIPIMSPVPRLGSLYYRRRGVGHARALGLRARFAGRWLACEPGNLGWAVLCVGGLLALGDVVWRRRRRALPFGAASLREWVGRSAGLLVMAGERCMVVCGKLAVGTTLGHTIHSRWNSAAELCPFSFFSRFSLTTPRVRLTTKGRSMPGTAVPGMRQPLRGCTSASDRCFAAAAWTVMENRTCERNCLV